MVGNGHGVLPEIFNRRNQLLYTAGAVKKAVFAMQMKVDEIFHFLIPCFLFIVFRRSDREKQALLRSFCLFLLNLFGNFDDLFQSVI